MVTQSHHARSKRDVVRKIILAAVLCAFAWPGTISAQSGPPTRADYAIVLEDVPLRPGVAVDLHLTVFVNEAAPCLGRTILAVPGFAHSAATFGPLAPSGRRCRS